MTLSNHTIQTCLHNAVATLNNSDSPRLDAELLLMHVLQVSRTFLFSHAERLLSTDEYQAFTQLLAKRRAGMPIAYLTGSQAFWSLNLAVSEDTLIPRPETELLVELSLQLLAEMPGAVVADLGTGSGAIALALMTERPNWQIYATDVVASTLRIAEENAKRLAGSEHLHFALGSWCLALPPLSFDAIISNPPYIAAADPHLAALSFEPLTALVAGETGLEALTVIIEQAIDYLKPGGYLLLEHGFNQAAAVRRLLQQRGYQDVASYQDLAHHERVTTGKKS